MRAAVCHAVGEQLVLEDVYLEEPQASEVRVKIKDCAICHSDLAFIKGAWGGFEPAVFGHEASGVIEKVGPDVRDHKIGDSVIVTLVRSCGRCSNCHEGKPVRCLHENRPSSPLRRVADGSPLIQAMNTAAFAEAVVVDVSQIAKMPQNMPFESAAVVACAVITGVGAVFRTADLPEAADVVVIGAGGVGLNTVQAARLRQARSITVIDMLESRLEAARHFGATHTALATEPTLPEVMSQITGGLGASHVFVTVGAKQAMDNAFTYARRGGVIVWVGMPPTSEPTMVNSADIAFRELTVKGSRMGSTNVQQDIAAILGWYQAGQLELDALVTQKFRFEQINEALAATEQGHGLRNVLVF